MAARQRTRSRALLNATLASLAVTCGGRGVARAQSTPRETAAANAAAAEAEFQEGRHLMQAKRYAEACPKFLQSYKLGPAAGTLLNLADCYEQNGQLASAWARYQEAIVLAQKAGRTDREKTARERADKLEPKLAKITIVLGRADRLDGAAVTLDGTALDAANVGGPVPVDPGKHAITVTAPGKIAYTTTIDVAERSRMTVDVPALEVEGPKAVDPKPVKSFEERRDADENVGSTQRTLGIVAAASGGVALAAGAFFGIRTRSKWEEAQGRCTGPAGGLECDALGVELAGEAKRAGNVATVAFIASGVLVAGGAVLFFTAPSANVKAGIGPGAIVVGGTFR